MVTLCEAIRTAVIEEGFDVNGTDRDSDGYTYLVRAVRENDLPAAQLLFELGAHVDARASNGNTPLHWASVRSAEENNYEMIKLLLEKGADHNDQPVAQTSPFLSALDNRSSRIIQLFLEYGADATGVDYEAICAVMNPHFDAFEFILTRWAIDIERRPPNHNHSALDAAAGVNNGRFASAEKCEFLIKCGAQVNTRNPRNNDTPLAIAVSQQKDPRVVQVLLDQGANVTDKVGTESNMSIFCIATSKNDNENIINLLIRQMAIRKYMNLIVYDEDLQRIENNDSYKKYYEMCIQELDQMHVNRFYGNISFLNILVKSENIIAGYARNDSLVKALFEENDYESKFPTYFGSLKARLSTEVLKQRSRILAAKTLSNLLNFDHPFHLINQKILSYINDADLKFFEM